MRKAVVFVKMTTLLFFALFCSSSLAYLPGVIQTEYIDGEPISLKVDKLTSVRNQVAYGYYDKLPFCVPDPLIDDVENLGEILLGDRVQNSNYIVEAGVNVQCRVLCATDALGASSMRSLADLVRNEYRVSWILDNLPAAVPEWLRNANSGGSGAGDDSTEVYATGFPVGFVDEATPSSDAGSGANGEPPNAAAIAKAAVKAEQTRPLYFNNHANIKVLYHTEPSYEGRVIVGFEVEGASIAHSLDFDPDDPTSVPSTCSDPEAPPLDVHNAGNGTRIVFTYSVHWQPSKTPWSQRWDRYLLNTDSQIQWFSIINSLVIIAFLTGMVAMIMLRTLRNDFVRYNRVEPNEPDIEETGWKHVHGDVFREPARPLLLSTLVGVGVQVLACSLVTLIFAVLGFLSPANRGALMTAMIVLFIVMSSVAGYSGTALYKLCHGTHWRRTAFIIAGAFPMIIFIILLIVNSFLIGVKSSGAVPFGTLVSLGLLWLCLSLPLCFLGSWLAFRQPVAELPVRVNALPRAVPPQPWYGGRLFPLLFGGLLPFGSVFIELFFVLTAVWGHQYYYIFSFLFVVFFITLVTCAEISIVLTYFSLCSEDYHWWWRSFLTPGFSAFYLLLYSLYYMVTKLQVSNFVSVLLVSSYSFIFALFFFVMTGATGFYATYFFVRKIYSSVKFE